MDMELGEAALAIAAEGPMVTGGSQYNLQEDSGDDGFSGGYAQVPPMSPGGDVNQGYRE